MGVGGRAPYHWQSTVEAATRRRGRGSDADLLFVDQRHSIHIAGRRTTSDSQHSPWHAINLIDLLVYMSPQSVIPADNHHATSPVLRHPRFAMPFTRARPQRLTAEGSPRVWSRPHTLWEGTSFRGFGHLYSELPAAPRGGREGRGGRDPCGRPS